MPIEKALVLNRREAIDLVALLTDRLAALRRIVEQYSPLDDDVEGDMRVPQGKRGRGFTRRKHRMVCPAAAQALAPGFPEIRLFISWPEYQAQARFVALRSLRGHPEFGGLLRTLDDQTLREAGKLGQAVLRHLDRLRTLPDDTRVAISAGLCARQRKSTPEQVIALIQVAAAAKGNSQAAGLAPDDLRAIRKHLALGTAKKQNTQPAQPEGKPHDAAPRA